MQTSIVAPALRRIKHGDGIVLATAGFAFCGPRYRAPAPAAPTTRPLAGCPAPDAGIGEAESGEPGEPGSASFDDLLRQFKIGVANQAIMAYNGNKTHAARRLRVSRTYLHRLLRLGPEKDDNRSEASNVHNIDAA